MLKKNFLIKNIYKPQHRNMLWSPNQSLPFRPDDFSKYSSDVKKALEIIRQSESESANFKKEVLDLVVNQHKSLTAQNMLARRLNPV
jgi:hypothetical protein